MAKGFPKGDPRAKLAGRKGGLKAHHAVIRSEDWKAGYKSGWVACERSKDQRRLDKQADDDYFRYGTRYPGQ